MRGSSRPIFWFLIALLLSGGAALMAYNIVQSATAGVPVVVVTKEVGPLEVIPADALAVETRPAAGLPKDAVKSVEEAVNRYTRTGLVPGMILQSSMIAGNPAEGVAGIDAKLQELSKQTGKPLRAFALELNAAQGYRIVQPNQRVDVIAHVSSSSLDQAGVLVPNVVVLTKIDKPDPSSGGSGGLTGGNNDDKKEGAPEGVVVLALTPEDAARVLMAKDLGTISLAPRAVGDDKVTAVPLVPSTDLLRPVAPEPTPPQSPANQGAAPNSQNQGAAAPAPEGGASEQ